VALKRLAKESLLYGIGAVVSKFFSLLIVPIIARMMPVEGFGQIDILGVLISIGVFASVLGLDSAIGFYMYKAESEEERRSYIGTALSFRILVSGAICAASMAAAPAIAGFRAVFGDSSMAGLVRIAALAIPLDNLLSFYADLSRLRLKPVLYNVITLGRLAVYYSAVAIFAVAGNISAETLFWARIVSVISVVILAVPIFRAEFRFCLDRRLLGRLLAYGLPLVPASIAFWVLGSSDKMVLNWYSSTYTLGIFSMGQRVSSLLAFVIGPVQMAWGPYALSISNDPDAKRNYAEIVALMIPLTLFCVLGLAAIAKPLIALFSTPEYMDADSVIGLLALSSGFNLLINFVSIGLTLTKKTHMISLGFMVAAGVSLTFNLLLCPPLGMVGVAAGSAIGNAAGLAFIFMASQRAYHLEYRWKPFAVATLLFAPAMAGIALVRAGNVWVSAGIRLCIVCAFVALLLLTGSLKIGKIAAYTGMFAKAGK
jgi:O-antigen/teichoic acid export membrane protein